MRVAPTRRHPAAPRRSQPVLAAALIGILIGVATVLLLQHDVLTGSSTSRARGSGTAATQTRQLARFSSVELAGSNNVTIQVGGRQSVVVHADDNLLSHVTTRVRAGNLVIGNSAGSFTPRSPMSVDVNVPALDVVKLTGSGIVSAAGITTERLTVTLAGSGVLRAGGRATRLDVTLAGSGDAQLSQLAAREVHAIVSGSGRILVTATRRLDAAVPGSGAIIYSGDPARVTTKVTGSGAVIPG